MTSAGVSATAPPVLLPPGVKQDAPDLLARAYDLPCALVLEMPAVGFSVGTLLELRAGSIVTTASQQNEDLPLTVNGQIVGMVEVDVVGNRLAVRLTGMA
jgi:flagellar motor switch/type III secretory pathway protein FliN